MVDGYGEKLDAQVTARIGMNFKKVLDDTRRQHRISEAELIRKLLLIGYEEFTKDPKRSHPRATEVVNGLYTNLALSSEVRLATQLIEYQIESRRELQDRLEKAQGDLRTILRKIRAIAI